TYADSRCAHQVSELRGEVDEAVIQQRTGTRIHTSYLLARFRWLAAEHPQLWSRATTWMSLSEYVHLKLTGTTAAGTSVAAWTGLLDRRTADWDPILLSLAGARAEQLSPVQHPDQSLTGLSNQRLSSKTWALLAEAHW